MNMQNSFEVIAAVLPPQKPFRFFNMRDAQARITELETKLELPPSVKQSNLMRANGRIEALEDILAAVAGFVGETAPPANAAVAGTPKAPHGVQLQPQAQRASAPPQVPVCVTFKEWATLPDADQKSFCRDGGKMLREEFLAMRQASQSAFLSYGGKIAIEIKAEAPKTKNPPANSIWIKEFLALSPAQQTAHFASGKKVHN